jgi:hypothetical protein
MSSARSSRRSLVVVVLLGAALLGGWRVMSSWSAEAQSAAMLANRPWIERLPEHPRDVIGHVTFLDHPRGKFGAVGRSSQWRHALELFGWRREGGRLSLFFPQERARGQLAVKTWRCAGEAPEPFDLCLELRNEDHRLLLFSREDWRIEPKTGALEAAAAPAIAALVRGVTTAASDDAVAAMDAAELTEALDAATAEDDVTLARFFR